MTESLRILVIGFGTVGQGLAKALHGATGAGRREIRIVGLVDRSGCVCAPQGVDLARALSVKAATGRLSEYGKGCVQPWDALQAIARCECEVMVELTPTNVQDGEPARSNIFAAFAAHRHVVTANKGPLALMFPEVTQAATEAHALLLYGGSVCGAIPIIEIGRDFLAGNEVTEIYGVLNGSCNYILSRMEDSGSPFEQALEEARAAGITESDPAQDIDGWDAAAKVVILANSVLGQPLRLKDVAVSGIREVTPQQIARAHARGRRLRLIGRVSRTMARVMLEEVEAGSPIAVPSTLNVAVVQTDLAKEITLIGRGAGQMETAGAVIADLNAIRRARRTGAPGSLARSVTVADIMSSPLLTVEPDLPAAEVVTLMRREAVSQVPVVEGGIPVGVVTEKSVLDYFAGMRRSPDLSQATARKIMGNPLPVVPTGTRVQAVMGLLTRQAAVLVGTPDHLRGIVTKADLIRFLEPKIH